MRRLGTQLATVALLAVIAVATTWWFATRPAPTPDVARLNDAVRTATASWPDPGQHAETVTLVAPDGRVVHSNADAPITDSLEAARRHALSAPIVRDDRIVATLYLHVDVTAAQARAGRELAWAATIGMLATALVAAAILVRTHRRIIAPFQRLQDFASQVAAGNLDAPLAMDPDNTFGAWTESFDLMRTELAAANAREAAASESKQQLVAQISHDIRTPVASIAATAELMRLDADPTTSARLDVIANKTAQLEALVADLYQANEEQIAALEISLTEFPSSEIGLLVREADYLHRATIGTIPACLVRADRRRLAQVIDNIVANTYKHAGTGFTVTCTLTDVLRVAFTDAGPGVPPDELGTIFARGVRGSNVDAPGQGLGLFTSAKLMERMGGDIEASRGDGFTITCTIALA